MTASCFADTAVDGSLATQDCLKPPRIRAWQAYLFRRAPKATLTCAESCNLPFCVARRLSRCGLKVLRA